MPRHIRRERTLNVYIGKLAIDRNKCPFEEPWKVPFKLFARLLCLRCKTSDGLKHNARWRIVNFPTGVAFSEGQHVPCSRYLVTHLERQKHSFRTRDPIGKPFRVIMVIWSCVSVTKGWLWDTSTVYSIVFWRLS